MTAPHVAPLPGRPDKAPAGVQAIRRAGLTTANVPQRQYHLRLLSSDGTDSMAARNFIEALYRERFGSRTRVHYPRLLVLADGSGCVAAAVGIRHAAESGLFLEQYLDVPVEQAIASACGYEVRREGLVELGSLAAASSRAAMYLIAAMAAYMKHQGFDCALVTSTDQLRRLFAHFGFALRCLGDARKEALPDGGGEWGDYYDHAPRVLAGSVTHCFAAVSRARDQQFNAGRRQAVDDLIAQARALPSW